MSIIIFKIKNIVWNNKQNKIYIIIKICREQTIKKSVYKLRIHVIIKDLISKLISQSTSECDILALEI